MKTKKFLAGLAMGTILGGVLGLFYSPASGKKNREKFQKISQKVSKELIDKLTKMKSFSQKEYDLVIENIVKKYAKKDLLSKDAWIEIVKELKNRFGDIAKEVKKANKK